MFFSLSKIPSRSECQKIVREYKQYTSVYELCNVDNCNYVLKTLTFSSSSENRDFLYQKWIREINNYLKVIECQEGYPFQFVPKIFDSWLHDNGDTTFYIIMENFEGDLKKLIRKFENKDIESKRALNGLVSLKLKIFKDCLNHVHSKCGIRLPDINIDTILYKTTEKGGYDLIISEDFISKLSV